MESGEKTLKDEMMADRLPFKDQWQWPDGARIRSASEIHIKARAATVWRLLTHSAAWPDWYTAVDATSGPVEIAKGRTFKWKSQGVWVTSTPIEISPQEYLAWTGRAIGTKAWHAWRITATPEGCRVQTAESFDGWLVRLMPGTFKGKLDETLQAWLLALKAAAESD